ARFPAPAPVLPPGRRRPSTPFLGAAQLAGQLVQHTVDVAVAVVGAEALGDLDRLVDDHAVRHVGAVLQLIRGEAQRGALDGVDLGHFAIKVGAQGGIQRVDVFFDAVQQVLEVVEVGHFHVLLVAELLDHRVHVAAGKLPRVQRLQRTATGTRAGGEIDALGPSVHHSRPYRLTISSAAIAASAPLLPALVPARSIACSMLSVVSTPNATGTPESSAALARPLTHSPAT